MTTTPGGAPGGAPAQPAYQAPSVGSQAWQEANPPALVEGVHSDDPNLQLPAVTQFRKLLSIERSPPIEEVIGAGVVPRFVQFLQCGDNPMLQFESAWALTNIASGTSEHTRVVIGNGAVPIFVQLLLSPNDDVREQVCTAPAAPGSTRLDSTDSTLRDARPPTSCFPRPCACARAARRLTPISLRAPPPMPPPYPRTPRTQS